MADTKTQVTKTTTPESKAETAGAVKTEKVAKAAPEVDVNDHYNSEYVIELNDDLISNESGTSESFKKLRTSLIYTDDVHLISMTSSIPNEGKTVTTFNLAKAFAEMGRKTLLIDCDLRRSTLKEYLMLSGHHVGLSEALTGQTEHYICKTNMDCLSIILAGKRPPNPSEILSNRRLREIADELRNQFDYIILDTPPVSAGADASIVARVVDGCIIVVRNEYTQKAAVKRSIKELETNGGRVIGVVLNRVKKDSSEYGHYGYYGYYY